MITISVNGTTTTQQPQRNNGRKTEQNAHTQTDRDNDTTQIIIQIIQFFIYAFNYG